MFNVVIYDVVRMVERESRSALPNAPVATEEVRPGRRFRIQLAVSMHLRRLADLLEPAPRVTVESTFSPKPRAGC